MLRTERLPATPPLAEPVTAWRAWTLSAGHAGTVRLRPIAGARRAWPPREPAHASCPRRCRPMPGVVCRCGLHATREPMLLRHARDPAVVGRVALWGRIVEHDLGFRAEFAYPASLAVVCVVCFWQWGVAQARADVVAVRRGRLLPLCEPHVELANRYGYRTPCLIPAAEVQQALLDAYAVEPLPLPAAV